MKVPGGWRDFFKNVLIAAAIIYLLNYLMSSDPSIGSSLVWAVGMCSVIAFVESRVRGGRSESPKNESVLEKQDEAETSIDS